MGKVKTFQHGISRPSVKFLSTYAFTLNLFFHEPVLNFFVFAAFVLKPNSDDPRRQAGHLNQLFLHQGIGTGIGRVTGFQNIQLFLAQDCSGPGTFPIIGLFPTEAPGSARSAGHHTAGALFGGGRRRQFSIPYEAHVFIGQIAWC